MVRVPVAAASVVVASTLPRLVPRCVPLVVQALPLKKALARALRVPWERLAMRVVWVNVMAVGLAALEPWKGRRLVSCVLQVVFRLVWRSRLAWTVLWVVISRFVERVLAVLAIEDVISLLLVPVVVSRVLRATSVQLWVVVRVLRVSVARRRLCLVPVSACLVLLVAMRPCLDLSLVFRVTLARLVLLPVQSHTLCNDPLHTPHTTINHARSQ